MNDSDVNASVLGMTVSHMNLCSPTRTSSSSCPSPPKPITPKLIAWKDTHNENKSNVSKTNDSLPFTVNLVSDNETNNNNEHNDSEPSSCGGYLDTIPEEDNYYHQYLPTIAEESESCQIVTIKAPISTSKMCDTDSSDLSTKRSDTLDHKKDEETNKEYCTFQEIFAVDYPEEFRSSTPVQDKTGSFSIDAKPGIDETPIILVVGDRDSSACFADHNSPREPPQNENDVEIIYHNQRRSNSPQHELKKEKEHFRIEISPRHFKSYNRKNEEYYSEHSPDEEEQSYDDQKSSRTAEEYMDEARGTPEQEWQNYDGNVSPQETYFDHNDKLNEDRKSHRKKTHKKNRHRNMADEQNSDSKQLNKTPHHSSYRNSQYEEDSEESNANARNDVDEYYQKSHKMKRTKKKKCDKNCQYNDERKSKRRPKNRTSKEKEIGELVLDKFLKEKKSTCRIEVEIIAGEKTTVKGKPKMYRVNSSEIVIRGDKCIETLNKSFSRNKIKHVNIVFVNELTNDESEIMLESDLNVKHDKGTFVIKSQGFDVPVAKKCARKRKGILKHRKHLVFIQRDPMSANDEPFVNVEENKARTQIGDNFWAHYTQHNDDDDDEYISETVDTDCDSEHNLSLPPINIKNTMNRNEQSPEYKNPHKFNDSPTRFPPIYDRHNKSNSKEDYDPFVLAEKQLMELLQCDDFKPYKRTNKTPSPKTKLKSVSPTTKTSKHNPIIKPIQTKRASVIEPPDDFQDKINLLQDNFEIIENFINDNFVNTSESKLTKQSKNNCNKTEKNDNSFNLNVSKQRKYSDEFNSIDPKLINATDNLKIPEKLSVDNYSPVSYSNDIDHYSVQYDKNISILEPLVLPKTEVHMKRSISQYNESLDDAEFEEFISSFDDDEGFPSLKRFLHTAKPDNKPKKKPIQKSAHSLNSSFGNKNTATRNSDSKKHPLSPLKRSVSLSNPVVKARSMKNKQDIQDYLHVKHSKTQDRHNKQQKTFSPRSSDELFPVGHDMYDEYKKYEEMYRRERDVGDDDDQQQESSRDVNDDVSSNEESPPPQLDRVYKNEKVNADSAYGSLNRKSPKIQQQQQKPGNVQRQGVPQLATMKHSPSSSGSDISASVPAKQYLRLTKFCHECGTKYPLDCAKFCVECGIKRLIL